jgi:hypothetical protein
MGSEDEAYRLADMLTTSLVRPIIGSEQKVADRVSSPHIEFGSTYDGVGRQRESNGPASGSNRPMIE